MVRSPSYARTLDGVRSYLPDGRCMVWAPPPVPDIEVAIDAEPAYAPVSLRLARRAGSADPEVVWPLWTQAEVIAKLLDLPVLSWLAWPGLVPPVALSDQVALRTLLLPDGPTGGIRVTCGTTVAQETPRGTGIRVPLGDN